MLAVDSKDVTAASNARWFVEHLEACIAEYMDREGVDPIGWRGQPLSAEEVRYFRRAVEAGLLVVDEAAVLLIDGFHAPKRYRLFQSYDGGGANPTRVWSWSWRESFSQLGFASELVLDHGWTPAHVALE